MALRLQYDEVEVGTVNTDIKESLAHFIATTSVTKNASTVHTPQCSQFVRSCRLLKWKVL